MDHVAEFYASTEGKKSPMFPNGCFKMRRTISQNAFLLKQLFKQNNNYAQFMLSFTLTLIFDLD